MRIEEKLSRAQSIFELQKLVLANINLSNYFDSIKKLRQLELQKEIIKNIPKTKPTN